MPYLNNEIPYEQCSVFLEQHKGLEGLIKQYRPKIESRKGYMSAYLRLLEEIHKTDLTKYGFREEIVTSPTFGTKKFYKTDLPFNWSELFEYVNR